MQIINGDNKDGTNNLSINGTINITKKCNLKEEVEEFLDELTYYWSSNINDNSFLKTEYDIEIKITPKMYLNFLLISGDNSGGAFKSNCKLVRSTEDNFPETLVNESLNKYHQYFKITEEEALDIDKTGDKYLLILKKGIELYLVEEIKKVRGN